MSRNCLKRAKIQKAIDLEAGFKQQAANKGLISEQRDSEVRLEYLRNQMVIHDETCRKIHINASRPSTRPGRE